jgi:diguanylate cyclase (GGDEF)-like protein/PAS domain S-box-containing protein
MLEDFVGWDPFPKVDNVILFLLLSALLYAVAIFRFGALEIVPIAHNLIVQNIQSGILVLDNAGRIVEINPFARKLIVDKDAKILGKTLDALPEDWMDIGYSAHITEQVEKETSILGESGMLYFLVQISPISNQRNQSIGHMIVLVDITDRKQAEMELERLARTDVLTGVTNRRHFFELAEPQFASAQRYSHNIAILLLDVDHFKQVNDSYGHLAGDLILQRVARECQGHLRSSDVFARYGGEEFICLLPEQSLEGALETAERIRQMLERAEVLWDHQSIGVTASIGVALLQEDLALTLETLINRADQALYESKANGRNQVTLWRGI